MLTLMCAATSNKSGYRRNPLDGFNPATSNKSGRRIALTGWFGSDNLGDELILRTMIETLKTRNVQPVVVSIRHYGEQDDNLKKMHIKQDDSPKRVHVVVHRSIAQHPGLVRILREVDGMVFTGGVMQAETSPWNIPFHFSRLQAASMAQCRVAVIGMGVGLVPGRFGRGLACRALRRAEMIVVRDAQSAQRLHRWGLSDIKIGADPVLRLKPAPTSTGDMKPTPADTRDMLSVILRHPNRRGFRTAAAKSRRKLPDEMIRSWAKAIDTLAIHLGLSIRLVAFQADRDVLLYQAISDYLNSEVELTVPTLDTVLSTVADSSLVLTMRYHGAITALLHNRPAVLLDYSPKMASLAAEGGGWAPIVDPQKISAHELISAASEAFDFVDKMPEVLSMLKARLVHNDTALDALIAGVEDNTS